MRSNRAGDKFIGLNSRGYGSGRFVDDEAGFEISERATHRFHRLVAAALELG